MFKIGEFSKLTQVSVRMLRYYDETGLLKPAEVNKYTGYRLYCSKQIPTLNKILFLRDTGFTVLEIDNALKHWDANYIKEQLKIKEKETKENINLENQKLTKIRTAMSDINKKQIAIHCNVTLKSISSYDVLSLRKIIPNYFCEGDLWKELCDYIKVEKLNISEDNYSFAIYHDTEFKDKNVDVEVCIITNQKGLNKGNFIFHQTEPLEKAACSMVYGPYENISPAYKSFVHWLEENNQYEITGISRQVCHKGPWNETDPSKYLTEIQIPVKLKEKF
ncbi:MerR family transcriptional regulator [Clostridium sp. P21]|uniref:MerR family transcriptional regulator n=1 Tax=Clostridium muellerianum TaxID=2716538 RepID=A0A7Y0EGJ1_9CLOT|nr:MerR family transcriptional regulator [Clostridium muellerianum]NMM62977.1 MerR family transcriptional regulator [Clostridium muellerianum]